ncbi:TetR/AcrR family transcriptional regulator [Nocardia sp. CY41]|uniref:TetR/AcrR family transcriptional regulator n=1 Tax=Nocardia sp. CY41 TaxID=2608686 RepID=UPI00135B9316|nr:helix-turn-helix domain-containing protein [Nocardia sp. CY41]
MHTDVASADLTAKTRIRNAALEFYSIKGETNTTLREVARAAGVTHGLVVHHFGSKEGLRRALDQHVLALLEKSLREVIDPRALHEGCRGGHGGINAMLAQRPAIGAYLRRALLDPANTNGELITMLVAFAADQVKDDSTVENTDYTEIFAALMREIGPLLLAPLANQIWTELTHQITGPVPTLHVQTTNSV